METPKSPGKTIKSPGKTTKSPGKRSPENTTKSEAYPSTSLRPAVDIDIAKLRDLTVTNKGIGADAKVLSNYAEFEREVQQENWVGCGVHPLVAGCLKYNGFPRPWPSQTAILSAFLKKRDSLALHAPHGIGKSKAIQIIATSVVRNLSSRHDMPVTGTTIDPIVIMIAPTHELAREAYDGIRQMIEACKTGSRVQACWGGRDSPVRSETGFSDIHVVVGCVGRIKEMQELGMLTSSRLACVLFDEAHILFGRDIKKSDQHDMLAITKEFVKTPVGLQGVFVAPFFAAEALNQMEHQIFRHTIRPGIHLEWPHAPDAAVFTECDFVDIHNFTLSDELEEMVSPDFKCDNRYRALLATIRRLTDSPEDYKASGSVMIICSSRSTCAQLESETGGLMNEDPDGLGRKLTISSHGGMHESIRSANSEAFNSGKYKFMFTTPHIGCTGRNWACMPTIICYDQPANTSINRLEDWLAKMSRTGRIGNKGFCFTLLDSTNVFDRGLITQIVSHNQSASDRYNLPQFMHDVMAEHQRSRSRVPGTIDEDNPAASFSGGIVAGTSGEETVSEHSGHRPDKKQIGEGSAVQPNNMWEVEPNIPIEPDWSSIRGVRW